MAPVKINIFCAECHSQIGIFDNEWLRLTASYARPRNPGLSFGTEQGNETQIVPNGPAQKVAEGCHMARVFCEKCSTMVAQHCVTAARSSQQHLVDQQFYKLSRVYLKNASTNERLEPALVDETEIELDNAVSVRSSAAPRPRWSSINEVTRMSNFSQAHPALVQQRSTSSSGPRHPSTQPHQAHASQRRHSSHASSQPPQQLIRTLDHQYVSHQSQYCGPHVSMPPDSAVVLSRDIREQGSAIADCFDRVAAVDTRIMNESSRITRLDQRLIENEDKTHRLVEPLSICQQGLARTRTDLMTQSANCAQHAAKINDQSNKINRQQEQLDSMTQSLEKLQETLKDLRATIGSVARASIVHNSSRPEPPEFLENPELMLCALRDAGTDDEDIEALRRENEAIKARPSPVASALNGTTDGSAVPVDVQHMPQDIDDPSILGKRKRSTSISTLPRKISRPVRDLFTDVQDDTSAMFTPEPTQTVDQSSLNSRRSSHESNESDEAHAQATPPTSADETHNSDDSLVIDDDDSRRADPEQDRLAAGFTTYLISRSQQGTPEVAQESSKQMAQSPKTAESSRSDAQEVLQTHIETSQLRAQRGQLTYLRPGVAGFVDQMHSAPFHNIRAGTLPDPYTPRLHPSVASRAPTPHFGYVNVMSAPCVGPVMHPSSRPAPSPFSRSAPNSTRQGGSRFSNATFSDALSRGQRLEDLFPQRVRSPSVLQPRQGSAALPPVSSSNVNAEAIDFSDEENDTLSRPAQRAMATKVGNSTTPFSEVQKTMPNGTLFSRSIPGLKFEPLERPVIQTASGRLSRGSRASSIMPEFVAAIRNLNNTALCMSATPQPATLEQGAASESRKKARRSEPVPRVTSKITKLPSRLAIGRGSILSPEPSRNQHGEQSVSCEGRNSSADNMSESDLDNDDHCAVCQEDGMLLCCDGCPESYHHGCLRPLVEPRDVAEGDWFCPKCSKK